jgi:hypothetical protein
MSISSVTAPPPLAPPQPVQAKPAPDVNAAQDDSSTAPPPPPPLPPGQGTRVNILA